MWPWFLVVVGAGHHGVPWDTAPRPGRGGVQDRAWLYSLHFSSSWQEVVNTEPY